MDSNDAAVRIAHILQPMKVMFLNTTGGLLDRQGNVSGIFLKKKKKNMSAFFP